MQHTERTFNDESKPYFNEDEPGVYVLYNGEAVYQESDWSDPAASDYVASGETEATAQGSRGRPLTVIGRSGNIVTVRTNRSITFSESSLFATFSGTIPAGATFTGADKNMNGVPDVLEKQIKAGRIKFDRSTD